MSYAARPVSVNGLTTATNATVSATAAGILINGSTIIISVGIAAAFPIYIMFGAGNLASTLTATTGFRLPAGFVGRFSVPSYATHLYHLRVSSDSDISVLGSDGGI